MVAYNFNVFLDKVTSGEKRMTIRKKARAKAGDKIQLYTGMRTKDCRKLREDVVCTSSEPIIISEDGIETTHLHWTTDSDLQHPNGIAKMDGFEDFEGMKAFFRNQYGLPFSGHATMWELLAPKAPKQ